MTLKLFSHLPSPLRMIRAWLARERAVRGPAAIELDVLSLQVDREATAVNAAAGAAAGIERGLDHLGADLHAALTDAETPGVITTAEARTLSRRINGTKIAAHTHTTHLEAML